MVRCYEQIGIGGMHDEYEYEKENEHVFTEAKGTFTQLKG